MARSRITLVHLSDVHFRKRRLDGGYDVDVELRNELEHDLRDQTADGVDGIIVTGDIAWAADPLEFMSAKTWLTKLTNIVGCSEESVWIVCGNHDVDRHNVIEKSELVQMVQKDLRNDVGRFEALQRDAAAATTLFSPLAAYNDFAGKYGCDFGPDQLVWRHDLPLNDGSKLRLIGLNSTLTSCKLDDDGVRLVLGDMSHAILREPGIAIASLCHHPPDWLVDHDQVTSLLNTRTRLQLFGHKHMQRIERVNDSLVITAGAVHPDRHEKAWEPRFNIIALRVNGTPVSRGLEVVVNARVWSKATRRFVTDTTDPLANTAIVLPLDSWTPPTPLPVRTAAATRYAPQPPRRAIMDPARRLAYRFLTLPYHERLAIANALSLLRDEDKGIKDRSLFERFFRRAAETQQLGTLWAEVEQRHEEKTDEPNPYLGR